MMMVDRAGALGLTCMVGNMIGTGLAMAPACLVAQRCAYVDLDGALALVPDVSGGARYADGRISIDWRVWGSGVPAATD